MVLVHRNEIYSPGKLMIAVQLWRRGYWKSPHGPWISRNGTSAWNMRQVIWYFPTHFITSPSRMLRNIHPRCIKSPSSNHFPFSQELDESGHKPFTSGRWDQFKANEELFGYVSTYKAGSDPSLEMMDVKNQGLLGEPWELARSRCFWNSWISCMCWVLLFGKILEDTIFNNLTSVFLQESL